MAKILTYHNNDEGRVYIKSDLKKLKKLKSLVKDIHQTFTVVDGQIYKINLGRDKFFLPLDYLEGCIAASLRIEEIRYQAYKIRLPITNPKLSTSEGCRLVFMIGLENKLFVPMLIYRAKDEGQTYLINNKKISLKRKGIKQILKLKLN